MAHTLLEARKSRYIDRLVVSTDDEQVARVAGEYGAEVPFRRPAELATDIPEIKTVIRHAVDFVERSDDVRFDLVVALQATSPFRTGRQIDEAIDTLVAGGFDSVISLKELRSMTWRRQSEKLVPVFERPLRRDELEPLYQEDGAIRVMRRAVLESTERLGARVGHVLMDKMSALTVHGTTSTTSGSPNGSLTFPGCSSGSMAEARSAWVTCTEASPPPKLSPASLPPPTSVS